MDACYAQCWKCIKCVCCRFRLKPRKTVMPTIELLQRQQRLIQSKKRMRRQQKDNVSDAGTFEGWHSQQLLINLVFQISQRSILRTARMAAPLATIVRMRKRWKQKRRLITKGGFPSFLSYSLCWVRSSFTLSKTTFRIRCGWSLFYSLLGVVELLRRLLLLFCNCYHYRYAINNDLTLSFFRFWRYRAIKCGLLSRNSDIHHFWLDHHYHVYWYVLLFYEYEVPFRSCRIGVHTGYSLLWPQFRQIIYDNRRKSGFLNRNLQD